MEGLIIFAIVSLIGFFLNKGKKENQASADTKQMPSMGQNPSKPTVNRSQPRAKSLEEYAAKVAREIERKTNEALGNPSNQQTTNRTKKVAEELIVDLKPAKLETQRELTKRQTTKRQTTKRETTHNTGREGSSILARSHQMQEKREITLHSSKQNNSNGVFPNTTKELAQAIIMSEILAPPVSKRR